MTNRRVFLTGGSGFVGRTLLRELSRLDGIEIVALDRSGSLSSTGVSRLRIIRGELRDPGSYADALNGCDCVIHLAAATGKASPEAQMNDTALGTEVLLDACRRASVDKFLLVSSIAATFPDKRGYPYAVAKAHAERAVTASGLRYCIVRPTMIFGDGAPVLGSLQSLAMLPIVVVPGSGTVRVQPISVDDVVASIISVLRTDRFQSETLEIGGRDIITMVELLQRLRASRKGKRGPAVRVPLWLIQAPLRVAERLGLRGLLPTTAGQLSSFRHDGVATPNSLLQEGVQGAASLDSMIGTGSTLNAGTDPVANECRVFTRHLLGMPPDRAVVESYRAALASVAALSPSDPWERALLGVARRGVTAARCADAFAAFFARRSALRKRLTMLLAILESRAPYSDRIDAALGGSALAAIGLVGLRGIASLLYLVAGTLVLVPVRMAVAVRGEPAR